MKEKDSLPCNALTQGYILLPKQLLKELLDHSTQPMNELSAWLTILTTVNFKDAQWMMAGTLLPCHRGESFFSLQHWAACFGWTRSKTRYYFARLQQKGFIRLLPHPHTTHLVVNDYELWTGCRTAARQQLAKQADKAFDLFWETYHRITQADKVNIARARREWNKLSPEERALATPRIEEYYYHLRSQKYCMQAAAYLANKAFLNEYND